MVSEATVRHVVRRLSRIIREFAELQGWKPDQYHLYVHPNLDWGSIALLLVAEHLPHEDYFDNYVAISDFIDAKWKKDAERPRIGLSLLTSEQVAEGGLYAIPSAYDDADDF
jgi:hypothetical protein